ncbi:MAG: hypothetical protein LBV26_00240 [Bacteroidales bacterium]|nr:hypothetical protein [Bacteroidales bacterium]
MTNNTALIQLGCERNKLTVLDATNNTALRYLNFHINSFDITELNALFNTLHSNHVSKKTIYIHDNPSTNGCDKTIATAKGWTFVN